MKTTLEEIYKAKAARRKELAALPYEEKVRLMEKLQEMGKALIAARSHLSEIKPKHKSRTLSLKPEPEIY